MLSTENLVFKKWLVKKLVDWYISLYIINKVVSTNIVKIEECGLSFFFTFFLILFYFWFIFDFSIFRT